MQLDLTRYRQPLGHFSRTFDPQDAGQVEEAYRIVAPVHLEFDVHKDKGRFRLAGRTETELELLCSRCLESFRLPVAATFDLRYHPASEMSVANDQEVPDEDLETSYYEDNEIDLNGLMREQFYLALPMKPLCQDLCRGLCPQCGTNLNGGECQCPAAWEDPRLAPLRSLTRGALENGALMDTAFKDPAFKDPALRNSARKDDNA
jgi:uncharacterized protein